MDTSMNNNESNNRANWSTGQTNTLITTYLGSTVNPLRNQTKIAVTAARGDHTIENSTRETEKGLAIFDTICIAFWGMARISEVTYSNKEGPVDWSNSVLAKDIKIYDNRKKAIIKIREAKTCHPGEYQILYILQQDHMLCPIHTLKRRLASTKSMKDTLFGWKENDVRRHLVKSDVTTTCTKLGKPMALKESQATPSE
ncbi:hypothetical protein CROQUDRAFT_135256 [Cronartium quercuum f. sp. fusiforme G11]|uniref:Uncharacterized protein n=1 Tax=Cronartium quercuum f. sp. fusiforme G11 TaxID=708437 RepID=A0A9P6NAD8_9BASI|nr:hypothetical protein CROQUDRAFT_135256 [Cronartium quercuum f. sp. fusiforme G11]